MAKVSEILSFVETLAPAGMAESWDNNGLLCGRMEQEVNTILVALDPFAGVIAEAIDEQADLILTHHPIIFDEPLKALNDETEVGRNLLNLSQHHIAAINAHTSLDQAPSGVNDCLAEKLGLAREEIAAVGDGLNDLELLEYAGIGAAMGNGAPELKQTADRVLPPVEEDGLAKFVQELLA